MWHRTKILLAPPAFSDAGQAWRARILGLLALSVLAAAWMSGLLLGAIGRVPAPWLLSWLIPASLFWIGCWLLIRRGNLFQASVAFVAVTWVITCTALLQRGDWQGPMTGILLALIPVGGALLGRKAVGVLSIAAGIAVAVAAALELLEVRPDPDSWLHPVALLPASAAGLALAAIAATALIRGNEASLATVEKANELLREEQERQATRIAAQARVLRTSAEISRRLSTILDQAELVSAVVNQIQDAFNYYHVHVYLFDDARENLVMVGGTGEAGRALLMGRHKVPAHKGLIGRAAGEKQPVLAPEVRSRPEWLPNPLLPDTRSEAAVPILRGDDVVGILDVQQDVIAGLNQGDVEMLQLIASQLAIALQNAYSFDKARQRVRQESLVNLIGQRIQRANTIDEVLTIAAGELGNALGAGRTVATLGVAPPDSGVAAGGHQS